MHIPTQSAWTLRAAKTSTDPFDLKAEEAYRRWREHKLQEYPARVEQLFVEVKDPQALTPAERGALLRLCSKANMALYVGTASGADEGSDKDTLRRLGAQLGLRRLDSNLCADEDDITSLRVVPEGRQHHYIPYTNRPLSWHTDGYYNTPERQIRAWLLHCASDAASGGENALLDHEIAYILMRDDSPEYVAALMAPDAMTIPPNAEEGAERPAQTGPVFSVDGTGHLHLRYTARKCNIEWKQDPTTLAAVRFLEGLLAGDSPFIFRHRLQPGQGVVANNVLHNRTGFSDSPERRRLIYRARYYDRVAEPARSLPETGLEA